MKINRLLIFFTAVALSTAISLTGFITPKPAMVTEYSADEAWENLRFIAEMPRPNPSERLLEVEHFIRGKLEILNIPVKILESEATRVDGTPVDVRNIYAEIKGTGEQSVLFVAHYDSVPGSPGAGDNGMSVAALLEALRAVTEQTGIKILFSDAEELGLLGASAFIKDNHELLDGVIYVINVEGYGSGPTMVIEGNELARIYFDTVEKPVGYSAIGAIPNTGLRMDSRSFIAAGFPCMSIANVIGVMRYHSPKDSFGNASRNSLLHKLEAVHSIMMKIAETDAEQLEASKNYGDRTFFMVAYGTRVSFEGIFIILLIVVVIVIISSVRQFRGGECDVKQLLIVFAGTVLFPIAAALETRLLFWLTSIITWNRFIQIPFYKSGIIILSAFIIIALLASSAIYFNLLTKKRRAVCIRLSISAILAVVGCTACVFAPGLAYLPLAGAAIISLKSLFNGKAAIFIASFAAGLLFAPLLYLTLTSLGVQITTVMMFSAFFMIGYAIMSE